MFSFILQDRKGTKYSTVERQTLRIKHNDRNRNAFNNEWEDSL